jgi:hypothetical protein
MSDKLKIMSMWNKFGDIDSKADFARRVKNNEHNGGYREKARLIALEGIKKTSFWKRLKLWWNRRKLPKTKEYKEQTLIQREDFINALKEPDREMTQFLSDLDDVFETKGGKKYE